MVTLIGMGAGLPGSLTAEGLAALQQADLILGAQRLLEHLPDGCTEHRKALYKPEEILTCLAEHPDYFQRGGSPDYGVINYNQPLPTDNRADGGEFHHNPEVSHTLRWLDEGAARIGILQQSHLHGEAAGFGVARCCTHPRVGYAYYHICIYRTLLEENPAAVLAERMDINPLDIGVGSREVDVLHCAHPALRGGGNPVGLAVGAGG